MWTPGNGGTADAAAFARATAQTVEEAVILGDRESVVGLVEKELEAGADPFELVRGRLIPAITEVGSKYERREYFLPQLLRSAETMQTAFARLKPLLEREANAEGRKSSLSPPLRAIFTTSARTSSASCSATTASRSWIWART